jgi:hypothetical protein
MSKFETYLKEKAWKEASSFLERQQWPKWKRDCHYAALYLAQGSLPRAESLLRSILVTNSDEFLVNQLYSQVLIRKGVAQDAIPFAKKAWNLSKTEASLFLYIHVLLDVAKVEEVLEILNSQPESTKKLPQALLAYASSYRSLGELEKAISVIDELLGDQPAHSTALRIRADIIADKSSIDGVREYKKTMRIQMSTRGHVDNLTKWNASLHFLRCRDFLNGWEFWEAGFHKEVGTMARNMPSIVNRETRVPLSEEINTDGWLLVVPEQGIGDQVLFMSGFKHLTQISSKILLVTDPRMKQIWERSFPHTLVADAGILDGWEESSLKKAGLIPYGSILPRFRKSVSDFTQNRDPFLVPEPAKLSRYRNELRRRANGKPVVGVSWRGGYWDAQKKNKNVPFRDLVEPLRGKGFIVSLQYGDDSFERELSKKNKLGVKFIEGLDFTKDIDDWLAITCSVDVVISISTALVHFSGAAGIETHILMPERQGPWILGMDDKEHIAYKNVQIHRPASCEPVRNLVERIAQEIL